MATENTAESRASKTPIAWFTEHFERGQTLEMSAGQRRCMSMRYAN